MTSTQMLFLVGIGCLLTGILVTWLYFKSKLKSLLHSLHNERTNIQHLEKEHSTLRTSSKAEILELKEALAEEMSKDSSGGEFKRKYEMLKVDFDSLKSQNFLEERTSNLDVIDDKVDKIPFKPQLTSIPDKVTEKLLSLKKKNRRKSKKIKALKEEVNKLVAKLADAKKPNKPLEKIEITKGLNLNKLKGWLQKDDAYKIYKKVSKAKSKK